MTSFAVRQKALNDQFVLDVKRKNENTLLHLRYYFLIYSNLSISYINPKTTL